MESKVNAEAGKANLLEAVKRVFRLSEEDERYLKSSLKWVRFKKGHVIDGQNEILQSMIYVSRGAARTYYIEDGREHTYSFTFASRFIVIPRHIMLSYRHSIFVQFIDETEAGYIPVQAIDSLTSHSSGEIYKFMNAALISHLAKLEEEAFMLRMDAPSRYEWAIRTYPNLLEFASITQLASFLNLTKETLYRIRSGKY